MNKVYASYGYNGYARPLLTNGWALTKHIEEADLILFGGGEDINPALYNEPVGSHTYFNNHRDLEELTDFNYAKENKIPMAGICRGMQLLTALSGGKLAQHVTNHAGPRHKVTTLDGEEIVVNSLHHQMCFPMGHITDFVALAWTYDRSAVYLDGNDTDFTISQKEPIMELEAVYYPNIQAVGVQWHPEMMSEGEQGRTFFVDMVNRMLNGEF